MKIRFFSWFCRKTCCKTKMSIGKFSPPSLLKHSVHHVEDIRITCRSFFPSFLFRKKVQTNNYAWWLDLHYLLQIPIISLDFAWFCIIFFLKGRCWVKRLWEGILSEFETGLECWETGLGVFQNNLNYMGNLQGYFSKLLRSMRFLCIYSVHSWFQNT